MFPVEGSVSGCLCSSLNAPKSFRGYHKQSLRDKENLAYVRPVDRLTPARTVETTEICISSGTEHGATERL